MTRINYRILVYYFLAYVVIQLPLLYKFVLGNSAFAFFLFGISSFIPFGISPFIRLLIGFFSGLIIDVFSNTPGLHAAASTLVMYIRDYWLVIATGDPEDEVNVNIFILGFFRTLFYVMPLVLIHHSLIFWIEHGKMSGFAVIFQRILNSTLLTSVCIVVINFAIGGRTRRT